MKTCPYCKEDVHQDAIKCRYCHTQLLPLPLPLPLVEKSDKSEENQVTYILDKDLIRFGKFSGAVLAVFLVVGASLFGFEMKSTVEKIGVIQKEAEKTTTELKQSQTELVAAKATVATLKQEVETLLGEAKKILGEMGKHRDTAAAEVVSIKELGNSQKQALASAKASAPSKFREGTKYWAVGSVIRISFIGGTSPQHDLVRTTAAEWLKYANLKFDFIDSGKSDVRISFIQNGGSWSYIGTDALAIPQSESTMNFGWQERGNILHEFGHALGLIEEHQNPRSGIKWDIPAVMKYFKNAPTYFSESEISERILGKIDAVKLGSYRDFDPKSIMTYVFDSSLTGGVKVGGASELSNGDKALVAKIYPQ